MSNPDAMPEEDRFILRPRISALLQEALSRKLVTIIAGPGFGKTDSVAQFLKNRPLRIVWLRVTQLDNRNTGLWDRLVQEVCTTEPDFGNQLDALGFPDTMAKFEMFVRILSQHIKTGPPVVMVLDDFHHIQDVEFYRLIENMAEMRFENFTTILLSRAKLNLSVLGLLNHHLLFQITEEDLKYTPEECGALFNARGFSFSAGEIDALQRRFEGWPFAMELYITQLRAGLPAGQKAVDITLSLLMQTFEYESYGKYSPEMQNLLTRLSLLDNFPADILPEIGSCPLAEGLRVLEHHPFIHYRRWENLYILSGLFKDFLLPKQASVPQAEQQQIYATAAEWLLRSGHCVDAMHLYEKAGRPADIFRAILALPQSRIEKGLAEYILLLIDGFPKEFVRGNGYVLLMRASLYFNNFEIEKAVAILVEMREKYEKAPHTAENLAFLGEVYILLADSCRVRNLDEFGWYYQKATEYLPGGSRLRTKKLTFIDNNNALFLPHNQPGELKRMEALFDEAMPVGARVMNGCGQGFEHLFAAEAAYNTCDFFRAKELAFKAIYKAAEMEQHDIVCNARFVLLRVAVMNGNYSAAQEQLREISGHIDSRNLVYLQPLAECAYSWYCEKTGDFHKIPKWIRSGFLSGFAKPPISEGRAQILYAYCLLNAQCYHHLMALLEQLDVFCECRGLWYCRLSTHVLRAVCLLKMGDKPGAVLALHAAYQISYPNWILMPFIEFGNSMRTLIDVTRKIQGGQFAENWLQAVGQKSSTFAKRRATLVAEKNKAEGVSQSPVVRLTQREHKVLSCLAQGLTREEIGGLLAISINTVKGIIKNIYQKLNAVNRADAVYIASCMGLLKG